MRERVLTEIQMLTGVYTEDLGYEVALLLKDGAYGNRLKAERQSSLDKEVPKFENKVQDLEEWFKSL